MAELNEEYYHSLKTILLRFAEITKTNNSALADAVLANKQVGKYISCWIGIGRVGLGVGVRRISWGRWGCCVLGFNYSSRK